MNHIDKQRKLFYMCLLLFTVLIIFSVGIGVAVGQVAVPLKESFQILLKNLSGGMIDNLPGEIGRAHV